LGRAPESAPAETSTKTSVSEFLQLRALRQVQAGYIHDSIDTDFSEHPDDLKRELMFSADLKYFKPIGLLLGYQGFLDGSGKTSPSAPARYPSVNHVTNERTRFPLRLFLRWRTQLSTCYPSATGRHRWILTSIRPRGRARSRAMDFVTFKRGERLQIRFAYTYRHLYKDEKTVVDPVTYDMWF
jgi:hypothetical protein